MDTRACLLNTLQALRRDQRYDFKMRLKSTEYRSIGPVCQAELEEATHLSDVVELLVARYTEQYAPFVALKVLRRMGLKQLEKELREKAIAAKAKSRKALAKSKSAIAAKAKSRKALAKSKSASKGKLRKAPARSKSAALRPGLPVVPSTSLSAKRNATGKKGLQEMLSIRDINGKATKNSIPYKKGIIANIIKRSEKINYKTKKQEKKVLYHLTLADTSGTIKATCYNEKYYKLTKENNGVLIWDFMVKNNAILITKQTKITKVLPMTIPEAPPSLPIKAIKKAKLKTLTTVCGTVTEEDAIKTVLVNGQETQLKSITIKDSTAYVKTTLWRETTQIPIQIGQHITITHVIVCKFNKEKILNTTTRSRLLPTNAPPK